eukprot:CAMPEP_0119105730 /NCGR_PEP_ID=MMETSP1180-20130426/3623_1 /TAXON_ID=3052 ORGANISM="Chlamydomonas cf sp, Strain CCMP681" /NCGR_SAMPLE_ID=MMETSP1180 /ASSEMBLY_ACC=CAM_ASM_000741 /LENGTH=74 /DNA_ID=CAMNT_0007090867 /DNA_START=20 /DNA_END=241 /DNA_ORIENTATION=-
MSVYNIQASCLYLSIVRAQTCKCMVFQLSCHWLFIMNEEQGESHRWAGSSVLSTDVMVSVQATSMVYTCTLISW